MNPREDLNQKPGILIVDDDPSVILALNKVLSPVSAVRFASSGAQALASIQHEAPALILLDIELPDLSGLELCAQLKAMPEYAEIPILIITGHNETGFEESVFDAGATDYIAKPLMPRVVLARTKVHLAYRRAMKLIEAQAYSDGLTGIDNRRAFDEQLRMEFKRARRQLTPLSLMMIDVDEFKKYNDHFGHQTGDECLKNIAQALKNAINRPADLVARYGGEEFAVILPDTDEVGVQVVGRELLACVESLQIEHAPEASRPHITISIGCSTLRTTESCSASEDADALLRSADRALYQAKVTGRNCCVLL